MKKVLLLGSGALKIGEAGEFDYSGSQAIKALKEEGIRVILVNPNIATIQTSEGLADEVYFVPVTPEFVSTVIEKERPDGILLSFGGQTALNCGVALHKKGIFKKYKVAILGTPIEAIVATEDRQEFAKRLATLHIPTAKGTQTSSVEKALQIAQSIRYPVMLRSTFALGGSGSGVAHTSEELTILTENALAANPNIIIEECLTGWKEIEYEVMRDKDNNCITICNMENFDQVGIHTGESIVVAPSQTLTNDEYYSLRQKAIDVIRDLGIVGECNIQFALNPKNDEIRVIEVNARLSRSSALASKATGYPIAYIAAKLAVGKTLPKLPNTVTGKTTAFFEPSLDYVVVKIPRWDLEKFTNVDTTIGSEMKSVGEVMSIARTFEEAIQKAARMLNDGYRGVIDERFCNESPDELIKKLAVPNSMRLFTICSALRSGVSLETIHELTQIDRWFLFHLQNIVETYKQLKKRKGDIPSLLLREAKQKGFSDRQIADIVGSDEDTIRKLRMNHAIVPIVHQIDTTGGEFPAQTNYLYLSYSGNSSEYSPPKRKEGAIVLGCGPYAIGTSVEFDWCAVNTVLTLKKYGKRTVVINCNPETVSTDFDISDTLYFEELTVERVRDIFEIEKLPCIVNVGGQISNNLATKLSLHHIPLLGTQAKTIEYAEDRKTFSQLLDRLEIFQPAWAECSSVEQVIQAVETIGYPVLVRPSFVLSGRAMDIIDTEQAIIEYMGKYPLDLQEYPLVISKFFTHTIECDLDGVAKSGEVVQSVLSEHVEEAGVHSGDSTFVFPIFSIDTATDQSIRENGEKIIHALGINGPFNIQFLITADGPCVIECNARASRSMPLVSKALKRNLIECSTEVLLGKPQKKVPFTNLSYFTVKVPQFSYQKLRGADPVQRVEMTSTGEVAAMGKTVEAAFLTAMLATGIKYPRNKTILVSLGKEAKLRFLATCKMLQELDWTIYATSGTRLFLKEYGVKATLVGKIHEGVHPTVADLLKKRKTDIAVVVPEGSMKKDKAITDGYIIRRMCIDRGIPIITNLSKAKLFIEAVCQYRLEDLPVEPWSFYKPGAKND